MKSTAKTTQVIPAFVPKAPDAIMAELWNTKQRINAEAGYDIDKLLARVKRDRKSWRSMERETLT
jgi:hypothetical protein